ncbi:MAG TPA: TIGR03617 family F420-dependent LLM class oxidoreductase [Acidimicrobiales bacterium]|nr:TIGR03617 family F420-dependent LLM class oxidoreductase [Acidimicrobiales bacterium]
MRVELMAFGMPLRRAQEFAADASKAGFSGAVVTEGGRSAYLTLGAMALAAPELELSTGIAVAFPRSPMVTAQLAWELADATGGRFRLGLGTQVEAHIRRRYDAPFDHPGPRLADYVGAVRAAFRAFRGTEPLAYEGEFYRLTLLPPQWSPGPIDAPDPPIDVAAVNPYMLRMAGAVADGVHVHPLNHRRYLSEVVRPNVDTGAVSAGRRPGEVTLTVPVFTVAGDTEEERSRWREVARSQIAFYGSTPNYAFVFDLLGRPGTTARLREHFKEGDMAGMAAVIDDDLLAEFAVEGTFAEMPDLLAARYGDVATRVVLYFGGAAWAQDRSWFERCGEVAAELRRRLPDPPPDG